MADDVTTQADELASVPAGLTFAFDEVDGKLIARSKTGWGADGSYVDASAANPLPVVQTGTPSLPTGAATAAKQDTLIGHVDGIETLLTGIDADTAALAAAVAGTEVQVDVVTSALPTGAATLVEQQTQTTHQSGAATSLAVIDDWDESDRAKVNPIAGQAGVQGGSGAVSATTQRVVLATDVALPAGTNAIGKLAANSGVDIGDVDVATLPTVASASTSSVSDSTTNQTLVASNASRKGLIIVNESSATLYAKYGATASLSSYTVAIPGYGTGVMQAPIYTGQVDGIWSADTSSGAARITEL